MALADSSRQLLDIAKLVELRFDNRRTTVDAMVLPGDAEVLLGSIAMNDRDVLIDLKRQILIVNPASPYTIRKLMK